MKLAPEELKLMLSKAQAMLEKAYAPYSKFLVGACIKSRQNNYYVGCNIENVSYSLTLCAEACAISNMIAQGDREIDTVVLVSSGEKICPPCGACRQILAEFAAGGVEVYMFDSKGHHESLNMADLLPLSFNQSNLQVL